mmetsp:Transcript_15572/g.17942  ORF Transcript_15572/g.17942 Transcript_15572/m.17942 type:complete len:85 (-) Transcript_15572:175-429(-)
MEDVENYACSLQKMQYIMKKLVLQLVTITTYAWFKFTFQFLGISQLTSGIFYHHKLRKNYVQISMIWKMILFTALLTKGFPESI